MNLIEALPLNRECTFGDVLTRVKYKTGQEISETAARRLITEGKASGVLTVSGGKEGGSAETFYRRVR